MPQRSNAFQRLVALLTATFSGHAVVSESAMLMDRVTGEPREVDILVEVSAGGYQVRIGIEVVSWARPADTPWVEKMRAKHENLPIDKLVLVSERGFRGPARRKADFYNIETFTIEEANEADWDLFAKLTTDGFLELMTINFDVIGTLILNNGVQEKIKIPLSSSINTPNCSKSMENFVRSMLDEVDARTVLRNNIFSDQPHDFYLIYSHPNGLWHYEENGRHGQFTELRVDLKVSNSVSPMRFSKGKFRTFPFLSGKSTSGKQTQFVLAKNNDGTSSGYLVDEAGIRVLNPLVSSP